MKTLIFTILPYCSVLLLFAAQEWRTPEPGNLVYCSLMGRHCSNRYLRRLAPKACSAL